MEADLQSKLAVLEGILREHGIPAGCYILRETAPGTAVYDPVFEVKAPLEEIDMTLMALAFTSLAETFRGSNFPHTLQLGHPGHHIELSNVTFSMECVVISGDVGYIAYGTGASRPVVWEGEEDRVA